MRDRCSPTKKKDSYNFTNKLNILSSSTSSPDLTSRWKLWICRTLLGTTTLCNFDKYILQLGKIHFAISGFDKQMDVVNLYDLAGHSPACFWIGGYESDPVNNVNSYQSVLLIYSISMMWEWTLQLTSWCSDVLLERVRKPNGAIFHRVGVGLPKEQVNFFVAFLPRLASYVSTWMLHTGLASCGFCSVVGKGLSSKHAFIVLDLPTVPPVF